MESSLDRIEINPSVCGGRPVFRGTRITVAGVLEFLQAGDSVEDILENFPDLKREDIDAAWAYVLDLARGQHGSLPTRLAS